MPLTDDIEVDIAYE